MTRKTPTLIGAAVGLAIFLAVGLLPALVYGGYAGVLLAGGIFGTPIGPTIWARALIVFGMVLGVTGGAVFGALSADNTGEDPVSPDTGAITGRHQCHMYS